MAQMIEAYRKAVETLAAKKMGIDPKQPRQSASQQKTRGSESDIFALPVDITNQYPLQDLDPMSATFGDFFFMAGYDRAGSGNPMR